MAYKSKEDVARALIICANASSCELCPEELGFKATNGKENYGTEFGYLPCLEDIEVVGNIFDNPELLRGRIA